MTNKSQKAALSILKAAKERGELEPSVEQDLAGLITDDARPQAKKALEAVDSAAVEQKRELSPEQSDELLATLEKRFAEKAHYRPKGVTFSEVKAALEADPVRMYSLAQMENTGGCPDVVDIHMNRFVFADCSIESPDRRDLTWHQAAKMAEEFGVNMMGGRTYRQMQRSGRVVDQNSWSWLYPYPAYGTYVLGAVVIDRGSDGNNHQPEGGWRGELLVKKV